MRRLIARQRKLHQSSATPLTIKTSAVLDAYTSILSNDDDGESAELYFTNTGFALLAVSLASSVAMNLLLPDFALNMIVAGTFVLAFAASLAVGNAKYTKPILALRRAGRFIWSDTPFVNFFSLIYIATVLKGQSTIRLQDYVTFRSIAVFELIFMKGRLASAEIDTQISLMRKLIATERTILQMSQKTPSPSLESPPFLTRNAIQAFTTPQRLSVMFFKTTIGHSRGCISGARGPAKLPLPPIGHFISDIPLGWKLYRYTTDVMILADCLAESHPTDKWSQFMTYMHGVLLRRLGKKRVVYLVRGSSSEGGGEGREASWHSNVNLVTGVSMTWLDENFSPGHVENDCVVA